VPANAGSHQPDPDETAMAELRALCGMCEEYLLDKVPEFELRLDSARDALNAYRQQSMADDQTKRALAVAIARFVTQAQTMAAYFYRHLTSGKVDAADDLDFVEGFRSLQLKTLGKAYDLYEFLERTR